VATSTDSGTGTIVQSWVPVALADELRARAAREDSSVSAEVRRALVAYLRDSRDEAELDRVRAKLERWEGN
jgi:plasmid stability protein